MDFTHFPLPCDSVLYRTNRPYPPLGALQGADILTPFTDTQTALYRADWIGIMSKRQPPVIGRIPAEIHDRAFRLGFIAETYAEIVAGHGPTGCVAWAVSAPVGDPYDFTNAIRFRHGTVSTHEHARAALRDALDELEGLIA